ncbi:MAG: hypothetical protein ACM3IJ_00240, partial [Candidatus Levyibacteriota bacterium]
MNHEPLTIYVFGNQDFEGDKTAIDAAKKLEKDLKDIQFIYLNPNEDLPFEDKKQVVLMDVMAGLEEVTIVQDEDLDKLVLAPRSTVHDYDLG